MLTMKKVFDAFPNTYIKLDVKPSDQEELNNIQVLLAEEIKRRNIASLCLITDTCKELKT